MEQVSGASTCSSVDGTTLFSEELEISEPIKQRRRSLPLQPKVKMNRRRSTLIPQISQPDEEDQFFDLGLSSSEDERLETMFRCAFEVTITKMEDMFKDNPDFEAYKNALKLKFDDEMHRMKDLKLFKKATYECGELSDLERAICEYADYTNKLNEEFAQWEKLENDYKNGLDEPCQYSVVDDVQESELSIEHRMMLEKNRSDIKRLTEKWAWQKEHLYLQMVKVSTMASNLKSMHEELTYRTSALMTDLAAKHFNEQKTLGDATSLIRKFVALKENY